MNIKTVKIIIFGIAFLATSCSQKPAPYVDKSNIIFSKSGNKNIHEQVKVNNPEGNNDAFNDLPQEQEIIETKLQALDNKTSEETALPEESDQKHLANDSGKLTDMDLEKRVDGQKVVYIGNNVEGYGNLLIIRHEGDIMTAYAHLKDIVVERGAQVKRGESIGSVGQVGNVKEPQLHFSIRKGKKTIDPEKPL